MAQIINTNIASLSAQRNLAASQKDAATAMQRLSSGLRINSAKDDAAGLAIANRLTSQINGVNQAMRNANDGISVVQVAEGALQESSNILQRMRELAIQASNDTNNNEQRSYLDLEFQQLKKQIVQIADNTEWNGFPVLSGEAGERVGEMPVYKATSNSQLAKCLSARPPSVKFQACQQAKPRCLSLTTHLKMVLTASSWVIQTL